jgi:hypothetical protein
MDRSLFEAASGMEGLRRLAGAWHQRVMADEVVRGVDRSRRLRRASGEPRRRPGVDRRADGPVAPLDPSRGRIPFRARRGAGGDANGRRSGARLRDRGRPPKGGADHGAPVDGRLRGLASHCNPAGRCSQGSSCHAPGQSPVTNWMADPIGTCPRCARLSTGLQLKRAGAPGVVSPGPAPRR